MRIEDIENLTRVRNTISKSVGVCTKRPHGNDGQSTIRYTTVPRTRLHLFYHTLYTTILLYVYTYVIFHTHTRALEISEMHTDRASDSYYADDISIFNSYRNPMPRK